MSETKVLAGRIKKLILFAEQEGNFERKIKLFKSLTELDPKNPVVWAKFADAYWYVDMYKEAIKLFEKSIKLGSTNPNAFCRLSLAYANINELKLAADPLKKAIKIDPNYWRPYHYLGLIAEDEGDDKLALEMYKKAYEINNNSVKTVEMLAQCCLRLQLYEDVLKYSTKLIDLHPLKGHAIHAVALKWLERYDEAIEEYNLILALDLDDEQRQVTIMLLANIYHDLGKTEDAIKHYRQVLALNPENVSALHDYADLLIRLGAPLYEEAEGYLKKAEKLEPEDTMVIFLYAKLLGLEGEYVESEKRFKKLLKIEPDDLSFNMRYADLLFDLERYEESLMIYEKFKTTAPSAYLFTMIGDNLRDLKRYEEAVAAYDSAIQLEPKAEGLYFAKGHMLGNLKRFEEAAIYFEKGLEISPDDTVGLYWLGLTYCELHRFAEARTMHEKVLKLFPDNAAAHASIAQMDWFEDNDRLAINGAIKALKLNPTLEYVVQNLKEWIEATDDEELKKAAQAEMDEILKIKGN